MKTVCIIPARLQSSRFPRKVLTMLDDKPMLQWVWDAAIASEVFDEIAFAIDDHETARLIESFEGRYLMTSPECLSGTDRLIELMETKQVTGDIWVNWQGDEPFVHREMITTLLQSTEKKSTDIWTLKKKIENEEDIENPNVVKVVTNSHGHALYFSRTPIPYYREVFDLEEATFYKHIGLYAYTEKALKKIRRFSPSSLELAEQLEQLRFLENGLKIEVHETSHETIGIDHPEDLASALEWIAAKSVVYESLQS